MLAAQTLTGIVQNQEGTLLENASLVLLSRRDSAFVAGATTDEQGRFTLRAEWLDSCLLRVNSLGYETRWATPVATMVITLEEQSVELGEVVVETKRPLYSQKEGRLYANVEGTRLAEEASAVHVLGQLPGVYRTGKELKAFLKGNVLVYVDNQRVSSEELEQLDVKTIDRVEVIQQPGVEYPSGTAAVLKIQTRRLLGLSAYLSGYGRQGRRFSYGGDAKLQYRRGSWTVYGIGGYDNVLGKGGQLIENTTADWATSTDVWTRYRQRVLHGRAGLAFNPSPRTSWLLNYRYAWRRNDEKTHSVMNHTTLATSLKERIDSRAGEDATSHPHFINTYLQHSFTERVKLELLGNLAIRRERKKGLTHEQGDRSPGRTIRTRSENSYVIVGAEAKTTYAFNARHSLQGGWSYSLTDLASRLHDSFLQSTTRNLVRDQEAGLFLNYRGQLHPSVQVGMGVRYEYVQSDRRRKDEPDATKGYEFSSVYPSASITYTAAGLQHALAYSHRVQHPSYRELTGTVSYLNRYLLREGNTGLRATRIQSLSYILGHRFFSLTTEYSYVRHPILDVLTYEPGRGTLLIRARNFKSQHDLQLMANGHYAFGLWQPSLTAGVIMNWHPAVDAPTLFTMEPLYILRLNNGFTLPWDVTMGLDIAYNSPGGYGLYLFRQNFAVGGYISKSFLRRQLTVALHAEDLFNSSNTGLRMRLYGVSTRSENHNDTRSVMLKVSYRFNRQIAPQEIPSSIEGTLKRAN